MFVALVCLMFLFTERTQVCALENKKNVTDRSGHGRRKGAVVHVGRVVHVAHHDVTWIARVWMAFTVQVLEFCCQNDKIKEMI